MASFCLAPVHLFHLYQTCLNFALCGPVTLIMFCHSYSPGSLLEGSSVSLWPIYPFFLVGGGGSQHYFLRQSLSWPRYLSQILHYWHSEHHGSNLHRTHHKCNFTTVWLFDQYPLPPTRLVLYGKASVSVCVFIQHFICKPEHST